MNSVLKQRLVGALILIALGAIFWPAIFVNTGFSPVSTTTQIPESVATRSVEIAVPRPSSAVQPAQTPSEAARADGLDESMAATSDLEHGSTSPSSAAQNVVAQDIDAVPQSSDTQKQAISEKHESPEKPVQPALDGDGIPIAWILRVGSFASREKAETVKQKLLDMGYKADTRVVSSGGRKLVRVTVGPKFERQTLVNSKQRIDNEFKVISQIVRYRP